MNLLRGSYKIAVLSSEDDCSLMNLTSYDANCLSKSPTAIILSTCLSSIHESKTFIDTNSWKKEDLINRLAVGYGQAMTQNFVTFQEASQLRHRHILNMTDSHTDRAF